MHIQWGHAGFELERKCRFAKKFVNFAVRRVYHKYQITLLETLTNAIFQFPTFCLLGACKSRSGHLQSKLVLSCGLHCNISPQQSNFGSFNPCWCVELRILFKSPFNFLHKEHLIIVTLPFVMTFSSSQLNSFSHFTTVFRAAEYSAILFTK